MTRDGGKNWIDVTDRLPGHAGYWISRIEASNHDPAVAYVTATGYRRDDFRPFVWKTTDYGATWSSIAANLPNEPVNVIREDHKNPNLLFVGTEPGLYVSIDGGRVWHDLQNNMPTNAVYDLQIHPRDNELIVGTHGRSIYIADITLWLRVQDSWTCSLKSSGSPDSAPRAPRLTSTARVVPPAHQSTTTWHRRQAPPRYRSTTVEG
jgi:photosystem II stability/assembly factor-like uncharacterized protein